MKKKILFCLLLLSLFTLLTTIQERINYLRVKENIIKVEVFEATTPRDVWGTLLLGGFRGIAVNILWVRAMRLQWIEEEFFELVALYEIIQALQPRFPMVWSFSAWNMAYNIAAKVVDTPEEEWKWIWAGASDLKEGIKRNPRSFRLPLELGMIYLCPLGGELVRRSNALFHRKQLQKEGKDYLYSALYWFERAAEVEEVEENSIRAGRMAVQTFKKLAERAEEYGHPEKKVSYLRKALKRLRHNLEIDPADRSSQKHYQHLREKIYRKRK